jgi:glycosyltransferase involved in cell wall biosynthesis
MATHGVKPVALRQLQRPIHPVHDARAFAETWSLLRKLRPDLLITRTSKGGVVGRIAGRAAGVPAIIHFVHGFAFTDRTSPVKAAVYQAIERFCSRFCDRIVSVNDEDREMALRHRVCPEGKVLTIKNGVDAEQFALTVDRGAVRLDLGLLSGAPLVLFASRLSNQKDPFTLVDAARILAAKHPEAAVCIAGTGPEASRLAQHVARAGAHGVVHLLGHRNDMPELLASADVFVALSYFEGLPKNILEAMAAGLPIVATNVKGSRELITDGLNGWLVPIGNASATAKAICWLLDHPGNAKIMGTRNHETIEKEYPSDRMVEQTIELIRRTAHRNISGARKMLRK